MMRKITGLVLLFIGLSGLVVSVAGVYLGRQVVDDLGASIDTALDRTLVSLDTAADTLVLTKSTFDHVNRGLETVGTTAANVAQTLLDTQPFLDNVSSVVTTSIPDSLEAIQDAMPAVAEAAGTIDDTLRALSAFEVSRELFGIPISFDLGINYDPEVTLDDSVLGISSSLDGMPDSLRAMQTNLDLANTNLEVVSTNIEDIAGDLESIGDVVQDIDPLIDDYIQLTSDIEQMVRQAQEQLGSHLETAKLILTVLFGWLALNQLIPIYLAFDIFSTREPADESDDEEERASSRHDDEDSKDKEANNKDKEDEK